MNDIDFTRYMGKNGELHFEDDLVADLQKAGWGEVLMKPDEQTLIDNFRSIINKRNNTVDKLNGFDLTDYEMQQVMDSIEYLNTPVETNRFLAGKTVIVKRDNKKDMIHYGKEIFLNIFEPNEIAGGGTVYQIARQPIFATAKGYDNRRGDVLLLINGIPVIHIELKAANVDITQAENQLQKYAKEGAFHGLFKMIQVFWAMNARDAVYFANPGDYSKYNPAFFFHWKDRENNTINDYRELCNGKYSILSIPNAHQLVGYHTIADKGDSVLKVLRPYQYWATRGIVRRVSDHTWGEKEQLGGYFWGTTGCGKTGCMYKTGWVILTRNMADKVIYLLDRTELNTQTRNEFTNFAYDGDDFCETNTTRDLRRLINSDKSNERMIITSIQKMSRMAKDILAMPVAEREKINQKRIVFLIDEAHRSEFGKMHDVIKRAFPFAMFFGFTGTPIFTENAKYTDVDKANNTTETLFGQPLAVYSIADGIKDENVLGFDPGAVKTYEDDDLRDAVAKDKLKVQDIAVIKANPDMWKEYQRIMHLPMRTFTDKEGKEQKGIEDLLPSGQYNNCKHREAVVSDIYAHWDERSWTGRLRFHALFATASIEEAVAYYRLFKEKGRFKVTALFDANVDNSGKSALNKEDALLEIVKDYNQMFGMGFDKKTDPDFKRFKQDVSSRLAHKNPYVGIEARPEECLDILIVVDQMLTGFDSKWVNTLYADKVMASDMLIQAVSRTNRIFNKEDKPFGIFRFYRKCYTMQKNLNDALRLYCQGDTGSAKVDDIFTNIDRMNELFVKAKNIFTNNKPDPIMDFFKLPTEDEDRKQFRRFFEEIASRRVAIRVQGYTAERPPVDEAGTTHELIFDEKTFQLMKARYDDLKKSKGKGGGGAPAPGFDIDTYLSNIDIANIDYHYLESHFEQLKISIMDLDMTEDERDIALDALRKELGILTEEDRMIAEIIIAGIRDRSIPVENKSLREYIDEYKTAQKLAKYKAICDDLGCDIDALNSFLSSATEDNINRFGKFDELKATVNIEKAKQHFGVASNFAARHKVDEYFRGLLEGK